MADIPRAGQGRGARSKGNPLGKSPARGTTPVFGQDNQINYKLMEKVPVAALLPADMRCLEEAIQNLEASIPTQPTDGVEDSSHARNTDIMAGMRTGFEEGVSVPIVTQKQMVESLEQMLEQRRAASRFKTKSNPLYRQCLKIHHLFLLQIEALRAQMGMADPSEPLKLPVAAQVEILLQILNQQVVSRARKYVLAHNNHRRSAMQKGFIALLTNMMEQVAGASESRTGAVRQGSPLELSRHAPGGTLSHLNTISPTVTTLQTLKDHATFGPKPGALRQQFAQVAADAQGPDGAVHCPSRASNVHHSNQNLDLYIEADSQNASPRSSRLEEPTARDDAHDQQQDRHQAVVRNDLSFDGPPAAHLVEAEPAADGDQLEQYMLGEVLEQYAHERQQQVQQASQQLKSILKSPQSRLLNSKQQKCVVTTNSEAEAEVSNQPAEVPVAKTAGGEKKQSHKNTPKASPERQAARQVEKDNSPVREFLNQEASEDDADFDLEGKAGEEDRGAAASESPRKQKPRGKQEPRRFQMDKVECSEPLSGQDSNEGAGGPLSEQSNPVQLPDIVPYTSMFDKGHYGTKSSENARARSQVDQTQAQLSGCGQVALLEQHTNEGTDARTAQPEKPQHLTDTTPAGILKTQGNYKLLLKCTRIWKIYTKQEIYRREQARLLEVEKAREMQERLDSEIELSKEISEIIHECAIARNHYNNHLMLRGFRNLAHHLAESRRRRSVASTQLKRGHRERVVADCFAAWVKAIDEAKARRTLERSLQQKKWEKMQLGFITVIRGMLLNRLKKQNKFTAKRNWLIKQRVCQALVDNAVKSAEHAQKADQFHRQSHLISLAFHALKSLNPGGRQRHIEALHTAQCVKAARILTKWSSIARENRTLRRNFQAVHAASRRQARARMMSAWCQLVQEEQRGQRAQCHFRARKVFQAFKKLVAMRERKHLFQVTCIERLEVVRQKLVVARWKAYVREIQLYRNFQLRVFTKFDLFKQRQIFKQWFNQVDVLKRWRFLNENTHLWHIRRMRKRVFKAWRSEIRLRVNYFTIEDGHNYRLGVAAFKALQMLVNQRRAAKYVHQCQAHRVGQDVLRLWYSLLNEKLRMRLKMQKKRDFYMLSACFDELREYAYRRLDFKRGMKSLLKTRARNLLRIAFVQGFKQVWHQRVIDRSLNQAADLFHRVHQQKHAVFALQRGVRLAKCAEVAKKRHEGVLQRVWLKKWLMQYLKVDAANRYQRRLQVDLTFRVFGAMRTRAAYKKGLSRRLLFFEKVHEQCLTKRGFLSFYEYCQTRRRRRAYQAQLKEQLYGARLKKFAFGEILKYTKARSEKGTKKTLYTTLGLRLIKKNVMKILKRRYYLKTREKQINKRTLNRIKQHCLGALIYNQTINMAEKLIGAKSVARQKARIFDGLARYSAYKKYFAEQEAQMCQAHVTKIKSSIFQSLRQRAVRKRSARKHTAAIRQLRVRRRFMAWREELLETIELLKARQLADQFFGKLMFERMKKACFRDRDSQDREIKQNLRKIQRAFYQHNSRRRALRRLREYRDLSQVLKMREECARTIQLRKFFGAWANVLDTLRRARILRESAQIMQRNALMERAVRALRERADKKIKDRLILDRFQERSEVATKVDVLLALHRHVSLSKNQRTVFYKKMVFLAERRVVGPFLKWMEFVFEHRLEERADKFFRRRKAQYLFRLSWDSLRVYSLHSKQKQTQHQAIDNWHNKMLSQRTVLALKLHAHESKRLNNVSGIIKLQNSQAHLGTIFQAFTEGILLSKVNGELKKKARLFYEHNQYRKTLIGLQLGKYESNRAKILREKMKKRIKRECMLKWYKGLIFKRRLQALADIFQRENDCRLAYAFFPTLVKQTYVLQIFDHMLQRRVHSYRIEFINQLRKQILLKKILNSFRQRSQIEMKRAIIVELKISAYRKQHHKEQVESHLQHVESEHHSDVLQIAFNGLKEQVVLRKFKRISVHCHKLKVLRKYFCALQEHEIRQKMEHKKADEVRKIQEAKYFWHWRKAFIKEHEKNEASKFLQSTFLYQVMRAWRLRANKQVRSRSFFGNVVQRNQMQSVFHAWILHVKTEQKNRECGKYLALLHRQNLEKKYMLIWLSKLSQGRIEMQMGNFYEIKAYRRVFTAWKFIKDKNNEKRVRMYRIREELRRRPELARPLKVLKNFLAFKAFNRLLEGAQQSRSDEIKEEDATFAYYMQLSKKAFLGLKLGARLQVQRDQTVEIGELNTKKRYLDLIKKGTAYLKERRKMRHKASIFRFLALQRKALQGLMKYPALVQELRVKKDFALQFYYKRTLDVGFSCLKIYACEKKAARAERKKRREERSQCATGEVQLEARVVHEQMASAPNILPGASHGQQDSLEDGWHDDAGQQWRGEPRHQSVPGAEERSDDRQPIADPASRHLGPPSYRYYRQGQLDDGSDGMPDPSFIEQQQEQTSAENHATFQGQRVEQQPNEELEEGMARPVQATGAAMFPSVGAINHFQGMNDGYNIFHNLSGTGSGIASAQLSTHQAQPALPHQRSAELDQEHLAELAEARYYDGDYVSQVPHREGNSRSGSHLPQSAGPDDSDARRAAAGHPGFEDLHGDELDQIQSQQFDRHGGADAEDDVYSLQSPPKSQAPAPLVLKIDDLLRESRRADFNLQAAHSTRDLEIDQSPHPDPRQPRDHHHSHGH